MWDIGDIGHFRGMPMVNLGGIYQPPSDQSPRTLPTYWATAATDAIVPG